VETKKHSDNRAEGFHVDVHIGKMIVQGFEPMNSQRLEQNVSLMSKGCSLCIILAYC
jgi:hypothetical protein